MSDETTEWYDHEGNIIFAPYRDRPTGSGRYDGLTHLLMRPHPGQIIQAVSRCGKRVHEVPGRGDVDCPRVPRSRRHHGGGRWAS